MEMTILEFVESQEDLPSDFGQTFEDNFWELITIDEN